MPVAAKRSSPAAEGRLLRASRRRRPPGKFSPPVRGVTAGQRRSMQFWRPGTRRQRQRTSPRFIAFLGGDPSKAGGLRQFSAEIFGTVQVYHAEKLLQLFDRGGWRKFLDGLDMDQQWPDSISIDHVSQEFHRRGGKVTLTSIILQYLEELGEMLHVFFQDSVCYQVIIQVGDN
jgi:hypothetical protein